MTVPNRLEALERGQSDILTEIGGVKGDIGRLQGLLENWMEERRVAQHDAERIAAATLEGCRLKHMQVDRMLDDYGEMLDEHGARIREVEDWKAGRISSWSTGKMIVVALASFVGVVATCVGIIEGLTHLFNSG